MNVITMTDHCYLARTQRFSRLLIGSHIATYGAISTHTTLASLIRLHAVACIGQSGEPARQRLGVIEEISEEIELLE